MSLNRCIFIGRLCADPELKYTPSGKAVANFRIAVDRNQARGANGEKETDFLTIIAWEKQAEFVANYVQKGHLVAIEARCQVRSYQTNQGEKRWVTEFVADRVQSLQPRDRNGDGEDEGSATPAAGGAPAAGGGFPAPLGDPFADM